jgi:glycosyltransferase involved in cell wall biosynthesis
MKIAQIAPLIESVPPRTYGGTERIVSYLTEELMRMGHDVTLFASGDSISEARIVAPIGVAVRSNPKIVDSLPYYMSMLQRVADDAHDFDVLHFHIEQLHFPAFSPIASKTLTTLHGRQDTPDLAHLYEAFPAMPLVSISDSQQSGLRARWMKTIYHGLPEMLLTPGLEEERTDLVFLGRISPEKGIEAAIEIAQRSGLPLKVAAKIDASDRRYFDSISTLFKLPGIDFVGEVDERQKQDILRRARALLFPINWPEPFGLVMIEAMACGTPVLAFGHGSVPEVIDHGITGIFVDSIDEAVAALPRTLALNRQQIRKRFEARFTARRMAEDYVDLYERMNWRLRNQARKRPGIHGIVAAE